MKKTIAGGLAALGAFAAIGANAAAVDVTEVVADIAAQSAPITSIGGAVLIVYVGIKAFRWVRQAMS